MSWLKEAAEKAQRVVPTVVGRRTDSVRLLEDGVGEVGARESSDAPAGREEESDWAKASMATVVELGSKGHMA